MFKKRLMTAAAVTAAICMLGGCGNSKSEEAATEVTTEAAVSETTEIDIDAAEYVKLGEYKGLTIEGTSSEVTDDDVEEYVESLAQEYIEYQEVEDRDTVQDDDYLNVDYATTIDGEESDDYSDSDLDIHIGDGSLNVDDDVDVDDKLIGAKVGDVVTVDFTFPDDYDDDTVAGKDCEIAVTVNAIEEEIVPELTDDFIKENTDCDTLEEYREQVREELESSAVEEAEQTNQDTLWNQIVDNAEQIKEFPDDIIEQEVANIETENEEMATYLGLSVSEFIEEYYVMTLEEYAQDNLKKQCVQDLLVEAENIEVTDEDVDEEIQYYIDQLGYESEEDVLETISEDELRSELEYTKLMEALMEETTVTEA